ncbi:MAG: DUF1956 domain-containing protein [Alphaproteobacteria bacterium]|nr:DUF1956 domain-containing protein [Alphaproteobacteria bacterium]
MLGVMDRHMPEAPEAAAAPDRSEASRRLVAAALRAFGERGYKGASTRSIAAQAGVNIAAIPYYFGSKQGLYQAVADHIAEEIMSRMGDALAEAGRLADDTGATDEQLRATLLALADRFVLLMVGSREASVWARFIVREQFEPSEAFDVLYEKIMGRAYAVLGRLLARLLGLPPDSQEAKLRVFPVIGQVLIFRLARPAVLRRMEWDGYSAEHLDVIRRVVRHHIEAILASGRLA